MTSILTIQALNLLVQLRVSLVLQARLVIKEVCQHLTPLALFVKQGIIVHQQRPKLLALLVFTVQQVHPHQLSALTDITIILQHKLVVRNVHLATIAVMLV